jgi:nicotinate-nucleotide adenylyltransferase
VRRLGLQGGSRLGLLGGTFDPIHLGHLDVARAAAGALALDEVRLMTSHVPPHRDAPGASVFHRFAMTSLAAAAGDWLTASDEELARTGASYTADTLRALQQQGWAATQLFFLTGADAFAEIATWKDYPALLNLAHFVVCSRPGRAAGVVRGLLPDLRDRMIDASPEADLSGAARIVLLDARTTDVSSTAVRAAVAAGSSIDGMVPPAVAAHIRKHGLYR